MSAIKLLRQSCFGMFAGCLFAPAFAEQASAALLSNEDLLLANVSNFLGHFIDPSKTPSQQAELFTKDAEYYEYGRVGRTAIIRDIEHFSRRWPHREYRLGAIHYIRTDPASNKLFVSYEIDYRVASRKRAAAGKAHYGAVLTDLGTSPKIEWIKEEIASSR